MLDCIISFDDNKLYYTHCISLNKQSKKTKSFIHFYTLKGKMGMEYIVSVCCLVPLGNTMRQNAIITII